MDRTKQKKKWVNSKMVNKKKNKHKEEKKN